MFTFVYSAKDANLNWNKPCLTLRVVLISWYSASSTEYLVISSPHMQNKIVPQNLQVGCVSVPPSENARNLGVFFDQCMKMDKHISKVCQATYYQLRNISAIRSLLTRSAAESLIHSLVTSRIDFCNSLLVGLPSAMLNRLQGVQNAAARLLTGYEEIWPHHPYSHGAALATN